MFLKELYKAVGVNLDVHNLIIDYTLVDGRRAHIATQIIANGEKYSDQQLVAGVKSVLPLGSRVCTICEIMGDYEITELEKLATSAKLAEVDKKCIFIDQSLIQEYLAEFMNGNY